jgi:hypothetical protein
VRHRPIGAWIAVLVAGLIAVGAWLMARPGAGTGPDLNRIIVADLRNETGDTSLAAIGPMASDWISAGLTGIPGLTVINSDYVFGEERGKLDRRVSGGPDSGFRRWVDSSRAGTVVSGSYYLTSGTLEIFAEITDAKSGDLLLDVGPFRGPPTHPDSVLAPARDSIAAFVRAHRARGS